MAAPGRIKILAVEPHERGNLYEVRVGRRSVRLLLTDHALGRIATWSLTDRQVLQTLLFPEEVLRGHRNRFIAHRRRRHHVVRVVYEYEVGLPVVITVYNPLAKRYFTGGGTYEDQVLS
jgi:hypothetical protein